MKISGIPAICSLTVGGGMIMLYYIFLNNTLTFKCYTLVNKELPYYTQREKFGKN